MTSNREASIIANGERLEAREYRTITRYDVVSCWGIKPLIDWVKLLARVGYKTWHKLGVKMAVGVKASRTGREGEIVSEGLGQ